ILLGRDLGKWRKDRRHRVVYPDVDRSKAILDLVGGMSHPLRVGNVQRERHGLAAQSSGLSHCMLQAIRIARDEPEASSMPGEFTRDCAAYPGRGASDYYNLRRSRDFKIAVVIHCRPGSSFAFLRTCAICNGNRPVPCSI